MSRFPNRCCRLRRYENILFLKKGKTAACAGGNTFLVALAISIPLGTAQTIHHL
jgi:hypothetical protein